MPKGTGMMRNMIIRVITTIGVMMLISVFHPVLVDGGEIHDAAKGGNLEVIQSLVLIAIGYLLIPWLTKSQSSDVTRLGQIFLLSIPLNLLGWYFTGLLPSHLSLWRIGCKP